MAVDPTPALAEILKPTPAPADVPEPKPAAEEVPAATEAPVTPAAPPAKAAPAARRLPLLLDAKRLPFWLYMPNLIGYVRVIALFVAVAEEDPTSLLALRMLMLSLGLDYIDGPIARRLDMCTQFGDLLDHIADHVTMFWLVYITSSWQINVWANALHCAVALGYMAYYGCYFKHGGQPNWVAATIEANNYFNMPSMLWNGNTVIVPFVKISYMLEYGIPLKSTTEVVNIFDFLGLLVTFTYSIAVLVPGPSKESKDGEAVVKSTTSSSTPFFYRGIRMWFSAIGDHFFATSEVHGVESFPKEGPTILCFNHGNALADPLMLIRATPRMVRFCAKDTLWKVPIMRHFVKASGAVPLHRAYEHGEKAKDMNLAVYTEVVAALRKGDCLGFAPEGVSRFLPYMEQPLKTGAARIALEAVRQAVADGKADFAVSLAPVCLVFTHREKFRSDMCMRYLPPIRVDASTLARHTTADGVFDVKAAALALTDELYAAMDAGTINATDWDTTRLAITASRLHMPLGNLISLERYLTLLRGWVDVLDVASTSQRLQGTSKYTESTDSETPMASIPLRPSASPEHVAKAAAARDALARYQTALDQNLVSCARVRRAAQGEPAWSAARCIVMMGLHACAALAYMLVATPGLLAWAPVWHYVKRRERQLLSRGPRWNDSVAEMKMMTCGLVGMCFVVICVSLSLLWLNPLPALGVGYLFVVMRCYEEGLSHMRRILSSYRSLRLPSSVIPELVEQRALAKTALDGAMPFFDGKTLEKLAVPPPESVNELRLPKLAKCLPARIVRPLRLLLVPKKRDWHEVLRFKTNCSTMDYVR